MSWLFSQALADQYSQVSSKLGQSYAQLNVMPTEHPFWHRDKTMEFSNHSQFGLTCAVLTQSHGEELLNAFLLDSRAKTSVSPIHTAKEYMGPGVGFGKKHCELLATWEQKSLNW